MLSQMKNLKKKRITTKEYSKSWMNKWQYFVMFWCSVFFISDIIFNQAEHCVELCVCLVTSVAATFVVYLPKAYFGKRNEEENKMINNLQELEVTQYENDEFEMEDDGK